MLDDRLSFKPVEYFHRDVLASSPDLEGTTGKYYVKREPVHSSSISRDEQVAQRLWEISENLTLLNQSANNRLSGE